VVEAKHSAARDYTDLIRVEISAGDSTVRVAGTLIGRRDRPHLLEAWGQRFDVQLEQHITLFRYRDLPGMLGRVGTKFGAAGVNIISAAVGRQPEYEDVPEGGLAAMAITTSEPVPQSVVDEIVASDEFEAGQTVAL
jgi:D-3-phosphoglycerate dehydrogenase / 2-oxoglutarate reductase